MICQIGANFIIQHHRNNFFESHCERPGFTGAFFILWAREPVKIWSEAEYFHKKPPAMRVVGKGL